MGPFYSDLPGKAEVRAAHMARLTEEKAHWE